MAKNLFELLGIHRAEDFDPEMHWAGKDPGSTLAVPVGYANDDSGVEIEMSRFHGLDDHFLAVGEPAAGTTMLLEAIAFVLTLRREPDDLQVLAVQGAPTSRAFDWLKRTSHCAGLVHPTDDDGNTAWRLSEVLIGEMLRRREAIESADVTNISDYQQKFASGHDFPELFVVVEDVTWLLADEHFRRVWRDLRVDGHRLAIRLVVGAPYTTWNTLGSNVFASIAARFAVGLTSAQSSAVFGTEVPDRALEAGQAYLLDGNRMPVPFHLVSIWEQHREKHLQRGV